MINKIKVICVCVFVLTTIIVAPVYGQTNDGSGVEVDSRVKTNQVDVKANLKVEKSSNRESIKDKNYNNAENREEAIEKKIEARDENRDNRDSVIKDKRIEKNNARNLKIEAHRDAVKVRRDNSLGDKKERGELLKERLRTLKNDKSREAIERLWDKFASVNDRIVNNMSRSIARIEAVLRRVEARVDALEEEGRDVSAVRVSIDDALVSIDLAHTAIALQTGKIYSFDDIVGSEESFRDGIRILRDEMHSDLKSLHSSVKDARDFVKSSAITLKKSLEVSEE